MRYNCSEAAVIEPRSRMSCLGNQKHDLDTRWRHSGGHLAVLIPICVTPIAWCRLHVSMTQQSR